VATVTNPLDQASNIDEDSAEKEAAAEHSKAFHLERLPVYEKYIAVVWRCHSPRCPAVSSEGSLLVEGRFHLPEDGRTLYTSGEAQTALGENIRHLTSPGESLPRDSRNLMSRWRDVLNSRELSQLRVEIGPVLDCRNLTKLGMSEEQLFDPKNWCLAQALGKAARSHTVDGQRVAGLLVPSATKLGTNLVIFVSNLKEDGIIERVDSWIPVLFPDWADVLEDESAA
jgi:RES domain-containing protein